MDKLIIKSMFETAKNKEQNVIVGEIVYRVKEISNNLVSLICHDGFRIVYYESIGSLFTDGFSNELRVYYTKEYLNGH